MSHLKKPWFKSALEAHKSGIDNIHDYGILYLREYHKKFYSAKKHLDLPYSPEYRPNPFRYVYDTTMFLWLNYYKILDAEIEILKGLNEVNNSYDSIVSEMQETRTLYGITRSDFMFAAGEFRWPTTVLSTGEKRGLFIRDPWSEKRISAISDEVIQNVISFGGGGQGKTLVSLAVALMIFDYFIYTMKGARCMLSTVNKDKLDSVGWAYLCNLNSSTAQGISLYAGKAKIAGDHTLARPNNKDKGGVFKGILIGQQMNSQNIIDKLTGSHGHPFICYVMDEMQSTPDPPIVAAPNFTMTAGDYRIIGSGNFGENGDTLDNNIRPDYGWESVDETTGNWVSTMQNGARAIVLHFNNNLSPGMTEEGHRRFPHLPHKGQLEAKYPDVRKRNNKNIGYRRFWVGFRVEEDGKNTTITSQMVKENLADTPIEFERVTHSFFSFDSAPAEIDRNLQLFCQEGICKHTKQRVFGFHHVVALTKATESIKYYQESANELLANAKKNNVISGAAIVDWTGRPAQAELLAQMGFQVTKLIYNKGVPDGVRKDKFGRTEREIRLNVTLDFKDDIPPEKVCAHHISENMISLAAWSLRQYILAGRVRGINNSLIEYLNGERDLDEELYNRKYKLKTSVKYGQRFQLESKDDFKALYGFSPDLLDTMFQAALYMLLVRKLPLTPVANDDMLQSDSTTAQDEDKFHSELWDQDLLPD